MDNATGARDRYPSSLVDAYDAWLQSRTDADYERFLEVLRLKWRILPTGIADKDVAASISGRFPAAATDARFQREVQRLSDDADGLHSGRPKEVSRRRWVVLASVCGLAVSVFLYVAVAKAYLPITALFGLTTAPSVSVYFPNGPRTPEKHIHARIDLLGSAVRASYSCNGGAWDAVPSQGGEIDIVLDSGRWEQQVEVVALDETGWLKSTQRLLVYYEPKCELSVDIPADSKTSASVLEIRGTATPGSAVRINGVKAQIDVDGAFVGRTELSSGDNTVTIVASRERMTPVSSRHMVRRTRSDLATYAIAKTYVDKVSSVVDGLAALRSKWDDAGRIYATYMESNPYLVPNMEPGLFYTLKQAAFNQRTRASDALSDAQVLTYQRFAQMTAPRGFESIHAELLNEARLMKATLQSPSMEAHAEYGNPNDRIGSLRATVDRASSLLQYCAD